ADATAVEEQRILPLVIPVVAGALTAEVERGGALDEERALLVEKRLDIGQVHDLGIHLDLAEIGIDRRVPSHAARDPYAQVAAAVPEQVRAVERVAGLVQQVLALARDVGHELDRRAGRDAVEALEVGEARHESSLLARPIDDEVLLVPAREGA